MKTLLIQLWEEPARFLGVLGSLAGVGVLVLDLPQEVLAAIPLAIAEITRQLVMPANADPDVELDEPDLVEDPEVEGAG